MNQNFLEIKDVTFSASKKNKVNNVSFNLKEEGEIICLLGPSGIGKTIILRTMITPLIRQLIISRSITMARRIWK